MTLLCCQHKIYIYTTIVSLKLGPFKVGPFKVLKYIGKLTYYIEFPPLYSALYNVFHVSKLKFYIPGGVDGTSINVQLVLVDGEE